MDFEPVIRVENDTLVSDKCVWCGKEGKMSKSHLIPDFLGGWFEPKISCENCNNFLGHNVESEAKKNAFITAGSFRTLGARTRNRTRRWHDREVPYSEHCRELRHVDRRKRRHTPYLVFSY